MRKNTFIKYVWLFLAFIVCSCSDDNGQPFIQPQLEGDYYVQLTSTDEESIIEIKQFGDEEVATVSQTPQWLKVIEGKTAEGKAQVTLQLLEESDKETDPIAFTIASKGNKEVNIVVKRLLSLLPPDSNSDNFFKNWEQLEEITYYSETKNANMTITLPWADGATLKMPAFLLEDFDARHGWNPIFNLFGSKLPYLGFYNKWTGMTRVFYYQEELHTNNGEVSFVIEPGETKTSKYPYYHTLQYAIPVNRTNIHQKNNIFVSNSPSTFQHYVTPYSTDKHAMLGLGWHVFDIDMTCYKPDYHFGSEKSGKDKLKIEGFTQSNSTTTLLGSLLGKSDGKFDATTNTSISSSNGMNAGKATSGIISGAKDAFAAFTSGNYLDMALSGCGALYNAASYLSGNATDDYSGQNVTEGNLTLNFTGELNLAGYTSTPTSNDVRGGIFTLTDYLNDKAPAPEGVWSLAKDPVLYVSKNHMLSDVRRFNLTVQEKGYSTGEAASYGARSIVVLDPRSLEINLNTENYKNVDSINITWYWGVYPYVAAEHTLPYRKLLEITHPSIKISNMKVGDTFKTSAGTGGMKMHQIKAEDLLNASIKETAKNVAKHWQKGSYVAYHGMNLTNAKDSADIFIVDPQVYFPANGETLWDPTLTDAVVCVILTFQYQDDDGNLQKALFSKRFIPSIQVADDAKLKELYNYLKDTYTPNSQKALKINSTKNEGKTVYHKDGWRMCSRFIDIIKQIDL